MGREIKIVGITLTDSTATIVLNISKETFVSDYRKFHFTFYEPKKDTILYKKEKFNKEIT